MITLKLKGNFGNWLNQYSYARLLAEEKGYKFDFFSSIAKHPITKILKEYFPNVTNLDGKIEKNDPIFIHADCEKYGLLSKEQQNRIKVILKCKQNFDKNNLDNNVLNFYLLNKNFNKIVVKKINPNDLVINLRLGNFLTRHWDRLLLFEYFEQIILKHKYDRIFVVTQKEIFDKDFKNFFYKDFNHKYKPIYSVNNVDGNCMHDFNLIRLFDNIAISQSSFSWWAALLSDAKKIYYPIPNLGPWSYEKTMHIRMVNEPRYEYIKEDPYGTIFRQKLLMDYFYCKNTGIYPPPKGLNTFKKNRRKTL